MLNGGGGGFGPLFGAGPGIWGSSAASPPRQTPRGSFDGRGADEREVAGERHAWSEFADHELPDLADLSPVDLASRYSTLVSIAASHCSRATSQTVFKKTL